MFPHAVDVIVIFVNVNSCTYLNSRGISSFKLPLESRSSLDCTSSCISFNIHFNSLPDDIPLLSNKITSPESTMKLKSVVPDSCHRPSSPLSVTSHQNSSIMKERGLHLYNGCCDAKIQPSCSIIPFIEEKGEVDDTFEPLNGESDYSPIWNYSCELPEKSICTSKKLDDTIYETVYPTEKTENSDANLLLKSKGNNSKDDLEVPPPLPPRTKSLKDGIHHKPLERSMAIQFDSSTREIPPSRPAKLNSSENIPLAASSSCDSCFEPSVRPKTQPNSRIHSNTSSDSGADSKTSSDSFSYERIDKDELESSTTPTEDQKETKDSGLSLERLRDHEKHYSSELDLLKNSDRNSREMETRLPSPNSVSEGGSLHSLSQSELSVRGRESALNHISSHSDLKLDVHSICGKNIRSFALSAIDNSSLKDNCGNIYDKCLCNNIPCCRNSESQSSFSVKTASKISPTSPVDPRFRIESAADSGRTSASENGIMVRSYESSCSSSVFNSPINETELEWVCSGVEPLQDVLPVSVKEKITVPDTQDIPPAVPPHKPHHRLLKALVCPTTPSHISKPQPPERTTSDKKDREKKKELNKIDTNMTTSNSTDNISANNVNSQGLAVAGSPAGFCPNAHPRLTRQPSLKEWLKKYPKVDVTFDDPLPSSE